MFFPVYKFDQLSLDISVMALEIVNMRFGVTNSVVSQKSCILALGTRLPVSNFVAVAFVV
jgi:hypothetical protein